MARNPQEHDIQRAWCLWFGGEPNKIDPAQLPGIVWWHTPNGGERRDGFEGTRLKQIGVKAGIPDIFILWGALYAIEFKAAAGRLSPAQKTIQPQLIAAGARIVTVYSLDEAKAAVRQWGLVRSGF